MISTMMDSPKNEPNVAKMRKFAYTVITPSELYVKDCPQDLYDSLFFRKDYLAEVNRFDTLEEANMFISQKYLCYAFSVTGAYLPAALPKSDTFALALDPAAQALAMGMPTMSPVVSQTYATMPMLPQGSQTAIPQSIPQNPACPGFWAIDCLNGYGITSNDLSDFLDAMTCAELVAPHALLCFDEDTASRMAYGEYIRRFYCRYDGHRFHPLIFYHPLKAGEVLHDPGYEEREKGFAMSDTHLGLLMKGLL